MERGPFTIELTSEEVLFASAIQFNPHELLNNTQSFHANGDLVVQLTNSLLARNAIPDQRLRYFSDPEYNIGGRGASRQELFQQNVSNNIEKMMRHGHFLKYLHYFIHGANLPSPILTKFTDAVKECGQITSGDLASLTAEARQLARTFKLEPKSGADEFYKLSLDLKLCPSDASTIRTSVLRLRPTK